MRTQGLNDEYIIKDFYSHCIFYESQNGICFRILIEFNRYNDIYAQPPWLSLGDALTHIASIDFWQTYES